jgi:hypothetical protein
MAVSRLTRDEAKAEAKRIALAFVTHVPGATGARYLDANPDSLGVQCEPSVTSPCWVVEFDCAPPGAASDRPLLVWVNVNERLASVIQQARD